MKKLKLIGLSIATCAILSACGSMNKIDNTGNIVNQDIKWGEVKSSNFKTSGEQHGMWKSKEDLNLLQNGMSKAQIAEIMGRPHYNEGFVGVREWNYVVNKNTPQGVKHCQLKITFDKRMNAQQFLWNPINCMEDERPVEVRHVPEPKKFNLRADFLFDFDKATLKPKSYEILNSISNEIKSNNFNKIVIVGHTDRIGSDKYNQALSEKRAITVSKFLVNEGIPYQKIQAYGAGETKPVKECSGEKTTPKLKECLADNRRVEIVVH